MSGPVQAVVGCCALKDAERQDALRQIESLIVSTAHQQRASKDPVFSSVFISVEVHLNKKTGGLKISNHFNSFLF